MKPLEKLYEGKAKILYATEKADQVIQYFKDDATAFNGTKRGEIVSKGVMNNHISCTIFTYLQGKGITTHLIRRLSDREMLVKKLQIVPIEVVVRNVAAGSLAKRMGTKEGTPLKEPVLEFYYKSDALGDPMINESHIRAFGFATPEEVREIEALALKINGLLVPYFDALGVRLIDYKLEFGLSEGRIVLGDEISPDTCRLWDKKTNEKMDKDRFRFDLGNVENGYKEIYRRVRGDN